MIISRAEIESAVSAYRVSRKTQGAERPNRSRSTPAMCSSPRPKPRLSRSWRATSPTEPLYRDALVNDLRRRIAEGKYYVPSEQIVERLLGRLVLEALPV